MRQTATRFLMFSLLMSTTALIFAKTCYTTDADFCQCFWNESMRHCQDKTHIPAGKGPCAKDTIESFMKNSNAKALCSAYPVSGVSLSKCTTDANYAKKHCVATSR